MPRYCFCSILQPVNSWFPRICYLRKLMTLSEVPKAQIWLSCFLKSIQWAYSIARHHVASCCPSSDILCLSNIFNILFSKATWPIGTKFHIYSPWVGRMKVCSNGSSLLTKKMALCPYMVKNLWKPFFFRSQKLGTLNLSIKLVQMMISKSLPFAWLRKKKIIKNHFFKNCWKLMYHI